MASVDQYNKIVLLKYAKQAACFKVQIMFHNLLNSFIIIINFTSLRAYSAVPILRTCACTYVVESTLIYSFQPQPVYQYVNSHYIIHTK